MENRRYTKTLVRFTYFSLGAFALISQAILLREFLVVVFGNEYIFGVLLSNWLLGIFTGALVGGPVSEKSRDNLLLLAISIPVMCALLPLSITFTRLLYSISHTPPGTYIGFFKVFLFSGLFIIPISFFIGLVFPIAARAQSQFSTPGSNPDASSPGPVKSISDIYIIEAFGSLFSGLVYTFFLVGRCNAYLIAAMAILPLLICSALILRVSRFFKTFSFVCLLILLNLAAFLPTVNRSIDAFSVDKRWRSVSSLPLVYSIDSRFQNIAVTKLFNQYNVYLNNMLASVFPNEEDNLLLAVHLVCQHPDPHRILILGDAVSGLAKALLRFDIDVVTSVEIDAKFVSTIQKFLPPDDLNLLNDKRFKIIIRDGREYIKELVRSSPPGPGFDLVFLDVPEPSTLLFNRFYTRECFADLSRVMSPNGVVALKITSSENYEKGIVSDYTASIFHTVKTVFPEIVVMPGPQNFLFASGSKSSISDDPVTLAQRFSASGMKPQKLGLIFYSLYPREKTQFIKNALLHHRSPRIDTDDTPIAALFFNKITGWYARGNLSGVLDFFEKLKLWEIFGFFLVLFLARWFYVLTTGRKNPSLGHRFLKFHILLAVFSGGLAGLSLELVILYSFQVYFGNIYHITGFIIALFMFGLPLGALWGRRPLRRGGPLIIVLFILGAAAFFLPYMMRWFSANIFLHQAMIFIITILIGFAVGLVFPLSLGIYLEKQEKIGKTAGIIDAIDHLGAAAGAFLIGTLLLPVLGVGKVCTLVALFPILTGLLLFIDQGDSFRENRPPGPPAKAFDKGNKDLI